MIKDCCSSSIKDKQCIRKKDKKIFKLPRKFSLKIVKIQMVLLWKVHVHHTKVAIIIKKKKYKIF